MDTFDMYKTLLDEGNNRFIEDYKRMTHNINDADDYETLFTSKEIVEQKKKIESKSSDDILNPANIEERIHFKRYNVKYVHKYTEREMEEIRESCLSTIVHDYGEKDIYHISQEERLRNDMLAEISLKLHGLKRSYRKISEFIKAMRIVYEAWDLLERKNNFVHSREEFFKLVGDGKIVSNRIVMPKMKRLDNYNLDMVIKYISNPDVDISHLETGEVQLSSDQIDRLIKSKSREELTKTLLSPEEIEEIEYLRENPDEIEGIKVGKIKRKYIKGYDNRNINKKKYSKKVKRKRLAVAGILNKIQNNDYYKEMGRSYMITHSLFEVDKEKKSVIDDFYFDGSWSNTDEVDLYNVAIEEEMLKQRPPRERYLTYADKEMENFFNTLEDNGINTLELRRRIGESEGSLTHKRELAKKKENKKIEASILNRIIKLNNNPKFKKIVKKAEDALLEYREGERR
jgi:hypothetical protein